MADGIPINTREVRAIMGHVKRVVEAESPEESDRLQDEALVAWGVEFVEVLTFIAKDDAYWEPRRDAARIRYVQWLNGVALTARADEDERRAVSALGYAATRPDLARWALDALLMLPEDHSLRVDRVPGVLEAIRAQRAHITG